MTCECILVTVYNNVTHRFSVPPLSDLKSKSLWTQFMVDTELVDTLGSSGALSLYNRPRRPYCRWIGTRTLLIHTRNVLRKVHQPLDNCGLSLVKIRLFKVWWSS